MTPDEYADKLVVECREISFQYDIVVKDITWIEEKIRALYEKVLASPFTQREENMKELEFLMNKLRINVDAREKIKSNSRELGARINTFFGKEIWKDL